MKRILITDDNIDTIFLLKSLLDNYEIDTANTCKQALAKVDEHDYDILLIDIKLPDFTGTYLAEQIRKTKDVPIVFLTNYSTETIHEVADELNASFLTKKEALTVEGVLQDTIQKYITA